MGLRIEDEAEILVGTYEDYVAGYNVVCQASKQNAKSTRKDIRSNQNQLSHSLEQSFAVRCHSGSVRCLAANNDGSLAVSAGFDEMVNVFDLKKRKLLHTIELAVNCAAFVQNNYLICGAQDGNIYIYLCKTSSMTLVKTLGGHKAAVTSLSAHPSEKALLSISTDNTMRTWNLIKGRSAYVTNIKTQTHLVTWSKGGDRFLLAANNEIYLYNNSAGSLEHSFKLDKRVNSISFVTNSHCIVAKDSGTLEILDLDKGKSVVKLEAHETRIKFVRLVSEDSALLKFATASSDGTLKLWSIDPDNILSRPTELNKIDIGARLTAMTTTAATTAPVTSDTINGDHEATTGSSDDDSE